MHQRHARAVSQESAAPSMKRLAAFSVPLLAIGLSSPMLSLVDTAVVGRHAGPIPLAALAPATAYVDIAAYAATEIPIESEVTTGKLTKYKNLA